MSELIKRFGLTGLVMINKTKNKLIGENNNGLVYVNVEDNNVLQIDDDTMVDIIIHW